MQTVAATPQKPLSTGKSLSVSQTLHAACERHPALAPLIDHFSALYTARANCIESLAQKLAEDPHCPAPAIHPERLEQGVPVLSDTDIEWAAAYYPEVEATLFEYLEAIGTLEKAVLQFKTAVAESKISIIQLLRAAVDSNESVFNKNGKTAEIEPAILLFITQQVLSCILGAYVTVHAKPLSEIFWREAYCPVCGSFPDMSILQRPDADQSEFLAGGGGKKMMHCSCCSHQWHFRRGTCPACSNDEAGAIHYFHIEEQSGERVEYCTKCNTYLNNIDLRNSTATPDFTVAPLTLIHLDMKAAQKKLKPLVHTLWNTF
ncbi:formate dehydrogenase accessory protein FdhE [Halodesulfovibrio sp.]|uniref:formate dehydrogenase accessory protein FdhE n=1 Tax=Halodesulfovibrio sp. TaxID=1912772 RepID=UPI0025C68EE5|nr:formate dehydrogenase accessory protein FdhE [Halodesulfovibrio sp.]